MTDSRYPYTYACDFIRMAGPVNSSGVVLSRSDASQIRQHIAAALGIDDHELACKLADAYKLRSADSAALDQQSERIMRALGIHLTPLTPMTTNNRQYAKGHDPATVDRALAASPADRDTAFAEIALSTPASARLVNPRAGVLSPHPAVASLGTFPDDDSEQTAAELVYILTGTTVLPDVPFNNINEHLNSRGNPVDGLSDLIGMPTRPVRLYRTEDSTTRDRLISQLLLRPAQVGSLRIDPRHTTDLGHYGYTREALTALLRGVPSETQSIDPTPRYIHTLRSLASAMRRDPPQLYCLMACWILDELRVPRSFLFPTLPKQSPFTWHGGQHHIQALVSKAIDEALAVVCWQQKWGPKRRARPEELLATPERLHPLWMERGAPALAASGLGPHLPLLSAAGAPPHSAWVSGHAVYAAAGATVLNASYCNTYWPAPLVQASPDGMELIGATATDPSVHGEVRKMAENIGMGRVAGGLHYPSDIRDGLLLGQAIALEVLRREKARTKSLGLDEWGTTTFRGFFGTTCIV